MMFKRLFPFLCLVLLLAACGRKDKANTIISGVAPRFSNGKLFISRVTPAKKVLMDSAVVDSLGNFSFRLSLSNPDFFEITDRSKKDGLIVVAYPNDRLDVLVPDGKTLSFGVVKGSLGAIRLKSLGDSLARFKERIAAIRSEFDTLKYSYKYDSVRTVVKALYVSNIEMYKKYLRAFVNANSGSIVSIPALYQRMDSSHYFLSEQADLKWFLLVDSVLHRKYPDSHIVKAFHNQMAVLRSQLNNKKANRESIAEGTVAPDFMLKSLDGDTISLSKYKGRYVLLTFWASWAKPSVAQNTTLIQVYSKYKPYGFEIIQVSLDRNLDEMQRLIIPEMRKWKQVSEFKIWNSSIVKQYRVANIPSNFLINRQGVVVAKNVLNKNLYDTLRWYLVRPYLIKRDSLRAIAPNIENTTDR